MIWLFKRLSYFLGLYIISLVVVVVIAIRLLPTPVKLGRLLSGVNSKDIAEQMILRDMIDARKPLSDVCDSLRNYRLVRPTYTSRELAQALADGAASQDDRDPLIQSLKPVFRYALRQSEAKKLLELAVQFESNLDKEFYKKAIFYKQALFVLNELRVNRPAMEDIMDRTYNISMMARAVAFKPELLNDSKMLEYCRAIEISINALTRVSWEEEKSEFQKFLIYAGVDPARIGYNPAYKSQITIERSGTRVRLRSGWLEDIIQAGN